MFKLINAADDQYDLETIDVVGPTLALCKDENLVFNHQTCYTDKLLAPKLNPEEEAKVVSDVLINQSVVVCLNVNGMFEDYVDSWDEIADMDDEDWYLEGTVLEVKGNQFKLLDEEEETYWIPFKHVDTIDFSESSEEMFEEYE